MTHSTISRTAKDLMTSPVVTIPETLPVSEIASLLIQRAIGAVVVVNESGEAVGIVSESDIAGIRSSIPFSLSLAPVLVGAKVPTERELTRMIAQGAKLCARDVMSRELQSVVESTPLAAVVHLMLSENVKHIPVLHGRQPIGIIARHDILKLFAELG